LEKEIAAATTELEVLQDKAGKISDAIKDLEQRILDIGGARLLTQKSKVDGIKLHINLANDEITKAEVAKAKAEKDSAKLDTSIDANKLAMQELETELTNLNNQLGSLTSFVTELRGQVEEAQAAAENSREDLETLKAELDEKDQQIQQFRQKEVGGL
jgi:structural maintenance of chromosome 4